MRTLEHYKRSTGSQRGKLLSKNKRQKRELKDLRAKREKLIAKRISILIKFPSVLPTSLVIELDSLNLRINNLDDEIKEVMNK